MLFLSLFYFISPSLNKEIQKRENQQPRNPEKIDYPVVSGIHTSRNNAFDKPTGIHQEQEKQTRKKKQVKV